MVTMVSNYEFSIESEEVDRVELPGGDGKPLATDASGPYVKFFNQSGGKRRHLGVTIRASPPVVEGLRVLCCLKYSGLRTVDREVQSEALSEDFDLTRQVTAKGHPVFEFLCQNQPKGIDDFVPEFEDDGTCSIFYRINDVSSNHMNRLFSLELIIKNGDEVVGVLHTNYPIYVMAKDPDAKRLSSKLTRETFNVVDGKHCSLQKVPHRPRAIVPRPSKRRKTNDGGFEEEEQVRRPSALERWASKSVSFLTSLMIGESRSRHVVEHSCLTCGVSAGNHKAGCELKALFDSFCEAQGLMGTGDSKSSASSPHSQGSDDLSDDERTGGVRTGSLSPPTVFRPPGCAHLPPPHCPAMRRTLSAGTGNYSEDDVGHEVKRNTMPPQVWLKQLQKSRPLAALGEDHPMVRSQAQLQSYFALGSSPLPSPMPSPLPSPMGSPMGSRMGSPLREDGGGDAAGQALEMRVRNVLLKRYLHLGLPALDIQMQLLGFYQDVAYSKLLLLPLDALMLSPEQRAGVLAAVAAMVDKAAFQPAGARVYKKEAAEVVVAPGGGTAVKCVQLVSDAKEAHLSDLKLELLEYLLCVS